MLRRLAEAASTFLLLVGIYGGAVVFIGSALKMWPVCAPLSLFLGLLGFVILVIALGTTSDLLGL